LCLVDENNALSDEGNNSLKHIYTDNSNEYVAAATDDDNNK